MILVIRYRRKIQYLWGLITTIISVLVTAILYAAIAWPSKNKKNNIGKTKNRKYAAYLDYAYSLLGIFGFGYAIFLVGPFVGFIAKRGFDEDDSAPTFITKYIIDRRGWTRPGMQGAESTFPLYLYPETNGQQTIGQSTERTPNLNTEIVKQIAEKLGITFSIEKEITKGTFAPIDILDYIYAVLHSPTYREKYKEFLKIDFPRVPYPKNIDTFWHLVKLGGEIRQIHLLESPIVDKFITQYPIDGDNVVSKVRFEENYEIIDGDRITRMDPVYPMGRVYINEHQFFQQVPKVSWEFYIGGYQPAQKWLKDRKERKLEYEDILHYQKIIVALSETDRLMKEINKIEIE
jgi:hypothetical protein